LWFERPASSVPPDILMSAKSLASSWFVPDSQGTLRIWSNGLSSNRLSPRRSVGKVWFTIRLDAVSPFPIRCEVRSLHCAADTLCMPPMGRLFLWWQGEFQGIWRSRPGGPFRWWGSVHSVEFKGRTPLKLRDCSPSAWMRGAWCRAGQRVQGQRHLRFQGTDRAGSSQPRRAQTPHPMLKRITRHHTPNQSCPEKSVNLGPEQLNEALRRRSIRCALSASQCLPLNSSRWCLS